MKEKLPNVKKQRVKVKDIGPKTNPTGAKTNYSNPKTFQIISAGRD